MASGPQEKSRQAECQRKSRQGRASQQSVVAGGRMMAFISLPFLATLALAYSGWVALSLAMDRHYADIYGRGAEPSVRLRLRGRWLGTLALIVAFIICVRDNGWGIGPVAWLGTMTTAALLLVLQLCYAPRSVMGTGKPALVLAGLLVIATLVT